MRVLPQLGLTILIKSNSKELAYGRQLGVLVSLELGIAVLLKDHNQGPAEDPIQHLGRYPLEVVLVEFFLKKEEK